MTRVRLLTGAVVGMGVLILIGLAVLIVGIVYKAGETDRPEATADPGPAMLPATVRTMRTDPVSLGLPAASKVLRMTAVGGGVALLVLLPSGEQVVYVVPVNRRQPPFRIHLTGPNDDK